MQADFWHQRWHNGQIGFHKTEVNPMLTAYFPRLQLTAGQRVFVPLCGKTLDIGWLLARGYRVAGVELNETAVQQLFAQLALTPEVAPCGPLQHYHAAGLDVFVGDLFDLSAATLGPIDGVYDRAALVALPDAMRDRYSAHLRAITQGAPQLLLCFEYDQRRMQGPPFSIAPAQVEQHYGTHYALTQLAHEPIDGGLKGQVEASEYAWLLQRKTA